MFGVGAFTAGAAVAVAVIAVAAGAANREEERSDITDNTVRTAVLHSRQDLKLIAIMLAGITDRMQ
jgi:hypothetical protein